MTLDLRILGENLLLVALLAKLKWFLDKIRLILSGITPSIITESLLANAFLAAFFFFVDS